MRHRRSSDVKSAEDDIVLSNKPSRNAIRTSTFITTISAVFGFVLSTCTLLLIWSFHLENTPGELNGTHLTSNQSKSHWKWYLYSGLVTNKNRSEEIRPRYLIAHITADGVSKKVATDYSTISHDEEVLKITSRVNRAYAKKWKFDYARAAVSVADIANGDEYYVEILRDILTIGLQTPSTLDSSNQPQHIKRDFSYDLVWLFNDPSLMPVDFETNIFEHDSFVVTSLSQGSDEQELFINKRAFLWNLKHPLILELLDSWEKRGNLRDALSDASQRTTENKSIWNVVTNDTSAIYHIPFQRTYDGLKEQPTGNKLNNTQSKEMIKLQSIAELICFRYFPSCDVL